MTIGLDFNGTITTDPRLFRRLSAAFLAAGDTVYIISAVKHENIPRLREDVKKSKVPHTELIVIPFEDFDTIPQLKLEACKRLGVLLMIDDMQEVCQLLTWQGIASWQVRQAASTVPRRSSP